jgi:hypothetical protein
MELVYIGGYNNPEMSIIHEIEVWQTDSKYFGRFVKFNYHELLGDQRVSPKPTVGQILNIDNLEGWFEVNQSKLEKSKLNF